MTWVLYIVFIYNGVSTTNIQFDTHELCQSARNTIMRNDYRATGYCLRVKDDGR